jgi:hypothetical protein
VDAPISEEGQGPQRAVVPMMMMMMMMDAPIIKNKFTFQQF